MGSTPHIDPTLEADLVRRWQSGDLSALDQLLAPHIEPLRRHLAAKYGDAIAEEAVGEVGIKLARGVAYTHRGTFRAWLQTVGRRQAIDLIRLNQRIGRIAEQAEQAMDSSATHGAERRVRDERRRQRIDRHLKDLPTLHRAAVRMRFWGGASTDEISEALDLSHGQVRDRLAYALRAMRKKLKSITLG